MNKIHPFIALLLLSCSFALAQATDAGPSITVATYNIENWRQHFIVRTIPAARERVISQNAPEVADLLEAARTQEDEENWEIAQVILDPAFSPDIMVFQEGCNQKDLDYFNKTAIVFPNNSERDQNTGILLKEGFEVLQRKDQYHNEPDTVANERGNRLFARGPSFVLVKCPTGYTFWVGTNHQKSKSDNSADVTAWRNREARRTHEIIRELEKTGPTDVMLLGDMNDEYGFQAYELTGGGDSITNLVGPQADGFVLATLPLAQAGKISYFGYSRADYRSLIDHIFTTRSMKDQIQTVNVFQNSFTAVASDHCPVYIKIRPDQAGGNLPGRNNSPRNNSPRDNSPRDNSPRGNSNRGN